MQQQQAQMLNSAPGQQASLPFSPSSITTEQIQKCLDDNKNLILAILENQNLGKVTECAQYQAILQRNLMYLAAIADAQPPPATGPPPLAPNPNPQQGHPVQQPQNVGIQQHQGIPQQKLPFQINSMRGTPEQQQQQMLHMQAQQQQMLQAQGMQHMAQAGRASSGDGQGKSGLGHNRDH